MCGSQSIVLVAEQVQRVVRCGGRGGGKVRRSCENMNKFFL